MTSTSTALRDLGRLDRVMALAGAGSFAATYAAASIGDVGGRGLHPDMAPDVLLQALQGEGDSLRTAASLFTVAAVLMAVFLGSLWTRLSGASPAVAIVGVAGGVLAAVQSLSFARDGMALASAADRDDGVAAQVLMTAGWDSARIAAAPLLVMVLAATIAGFRFGLFPVWFRWVGLVFLVPLVVALAPVGPAGVMGFVGGLWVLIASLLFAFERRQWEPCLPW